MIHKYYLGGLYIVLDVNSGGVHIVDELTYDLLDDAQPPFSEECPQEILDKLSAKYDPAEIRECYQELTSLYEEMPEVGDLEQPRMTTRNTRSSPLPPPSRRCACISRMTAICAASTALPRPATSAQDAS